MAVTQDAYLFVGQLCSDRTVAHQVIITQSVIFVEKQWRHGICQILLWQGTTDYNRFSAGQ